MDFIALKCNLGQAIKEALEEIVHDEDGRTCALKAFKEIFAAHYNNLKDDLPEANLTGNVFTWKEYPDEKSRQYFEALISQPKITQSKGGDQLKLNRLVFAKIEAM
jgi:uncharacterized protein YbaA (DUF1428 family)